MTSSKKKAPAATGAINNRNPNHYEGETMNTIVPEATVNGQTTTFDTTVLAWVQAVAQIRDSIMSDRIISLDDPRAQQLASRWGSTNITQHFGDEAYELEELHFEHFAEKPEYPLPRPAWADETEVFYEGFPAWPVLGVEHRAIAMLDHLDLMVKVHSLDFVYMEDYVERDGEHVPAGAVFVDGSPSLVINVGGHSIECPFTGTDDLFKMSAAIDDLARRIDRNQEASELIRRTAPGAPTFEDGI